MGFLDEMAVKVLGNSSSPLAHGVLQMINDHPGGLSGLVQEFHQKGLGSIVSSWVSTGQNLPVSAEQIQNVLGNERLRQMAAKAGVPIGQVAPKLAEYLPMIVDQLTPNGQIPQPSGLKDIAANLFESLKATQAPR